MDNNLNFLNFLEILTNWKKFLIINLILALIIAIILSLILPKWYKASALVLPPKEEQTQGGIASLLNSLPVAALGINANSGNEMTYMAILKSRTLAIDVINRFNLRKFYKEKTLDETLRDFNSDFDIQLTEENMISMSYEYTDSITVATIVNYIVNRLGKISNNLMHQRAELTKEFLEKRYLKNKKDIDSISTELKNFQTKYGILDFEEQTKALINSTSQIEAEIYLKEAELVAIKENIGETSVQYKSSKVVLESLKAELNKLKFNPKETDKSAFSSLYLPFEKIPELGEKYFKLYSDLTIQGKLQEFIIPQYEQAKLQLLKDKPELQVIDYAIPPDKKSKPKLSYLAGGMILVVSIISILIILIIEHFKWLKINDFERYKHFKSIKDSWFNFSSKK